MEEGTGEEKEKGRWGGEREEKENWKEEGVESSVVNGTRKRKKGNGEGERYVERGGEGKRDDKDIKKGEGKGKGEGSRMHEMKGATKRIAVKENSSKKETIEKGNGEERKRRGSYRGGDDEER